MKGNKKNKGGSLLKRFIGNKNTVTILGILACIATLIVGYNYRVKAAIDPISVPYAKQNIPSRTLITDDMVGQIKISKTYSKQATNLILDPKNVVKKYVSYKTSIPKNSLFYKQQIIEAEEMPDHAFSNIEKGYTVFALDVSAETSYYNSIRAGDYIDLYISAKEADDENKIVYAEIANSIRVLAVKDNKGRNIINNRMDNGRPSEFLFAVPDEDYEILMKAQLSKLNAKIEPIVRNEKYTRDNSTSNTTVSKGEVLELIQKYCSADY